MSVPVLKDDRFAEAVIFEYIIVMAYVVVAYVVMADIVMAPRRSF